MPFPAAARSAQPEDRAAVPGAVPAAAPFPPRSRRHLSRWYVVAPLDRHAVPQAGVRTLETARWRNLVAESAQVVTSAFRGDATLRRPVEEAELQQIWLVHLLPPVDPPAAHPRGSPPPPPARRQHLPDPRGQPPVGRVQALVIDVHGRHGGFRFGDADPAVGANLGKIANAAQQAVDDPRRSPPPTREDVNRLRVDLDAKDPGGPLDDRRELVDRVVVEPVDGAETVSQRRADASRPGRRANDCERLEAQPQAPR